MRKLILTAVLVAFGGAAAKADKPLRTFCANVGANMDARQQARQQTWAERHGCQCQTTATYAPPVQAAPVQFVQPVGYAAPVFAQPAPVRTFVSGAANTIGDTFHAVGSAVLPTRQTCSPNGCR